MYIIKESRVMNSMHNFLAMCKHVYLIHPYILFVNNFAHRLNTIFGGRISIISRRQLL